MDTRTDWSTPLPLRTAASIDAALINGHTNLVTEFLDPAMPRRSTRP